MTRPLRILLPMTIALAAVGGVVGHNALTRADEATIGNAADAQKRLEAEPFSLRAAWREIGREPLPEVAVSSIDAPGEAPREASPLENSPRPKAETEAQQGSAESPAPLAAASAERVTDGQDNGRSTDAGPQVIEGPLGEALVIARTDDVEPQPHSAPIGGEDLAPASREPAPQPASVSETATSALPEHDRASRALQAHRERPMRPLRRGEPRPKSVDHRYAPLAANVFRDVDYASP